MVLAVILGPLADENLRRALMIFEDQERLVGMVTDSDIRSAFLRLYSFDTVLDNFKRG